ncbi:MAG: zinc ABC transporter substrate-binding protein [Phycisphaerales bacterium]|nr:zinc ABC transporter substrate-binding protein [Phycisphaerales bacterium]MCI0631930.1 zinc ABC transporter substrate-binding protein [Phycisphaerales bacterium]MCI0676198.1 zinc ABC transporter substrate-binding protein [Phycisphaerales bacterium]
MKFLSMMLMIVAATFATGCDRPNAQGGSTEGRHDHYHVVTTTAMIADIVRNVAGDRAEVRSLMGAGVDPHLYRATRDDMTALLSADIVFYNGLSLEGKMSDVFVKVASSGRPVHAVTELLDEKYLLEPENFGGHYDPHVWMDPNGWIKATEVVIAKFSEHDSANTQLYQSNGQRFIDELKKLDAYARERLATVPAERRVLVTAHDAFNYFARAYDMEVEGIQGISTDSEAGLAKIESLVNMLVSRKISAVFTESSVSDKNIRALVEGANAQGHQVKIGGELFSDAMGADGTYEGTYVGMIDHNVTIIVRALGGEAPERGMNGKLKEH